MDAAGLNYPPPDAHGRPPPVKLLYVAVGLVVVAQIVGIYGLRTRKADLVYGLVVVGLVIVAAVLAYFGFSSGVG